MSDTNPAPPDYLRISVLAVDPGRSKCGVAIVTSGSVLLREIVDTVSLPDRAAALIHRFAPCSLVVGDGTGSAPVIQMLDSLRGDIPLVRVDESHTSELARVRYMAENPPRGLRRLLPSFLRTPEAPYDDYVAILLAERWLAANSPPTPPSDR
jgi:RNase H-fold protein (predicted Holliday junction resolvase)